MEKRENEIRKQTLFSEFKNIAKIVNDSIQIVLNTKNIETLKSRVAIVELNIKRMKEIEQRGFKFSEELIEVTFAGLYEQINMKIMKLIQDEYNNIISKKNTFTSTKIAINAISKSSQNIKSTTPQQAAGYVGSFTQTALTA